MILGAVIAASLISPVEHPLQPQINQYLQNQTAVVDFKPTGLSRVDYLKVVAGQVHALRSYQKPNGDIPDPVDGRTQFSPPCYAHAVATLAASGFDQDPQLLETGMRAMDFCVDSLAKGLSAFPDRHPDFYIYPVMLALTEFEKIAPKNRLEAWRKQLALINPKITYATYGKADNNWTLVHTAGEFMRAERGWVTGEYVEKALGIQKPHITPLGMYLEHGAPFAYDAFSRYFLTGMLQMGYQGNEHDFYRDACWRGAWTSLMIQSPSGELPTGYRSAQHIWNEAELAKVYEIYSTQYAKAGRLAEAGAFKRGAHLALQNIRQWIRPDGSGYIVKNRYPIEARHGYESYSVHANYNLLACSMVCAAWRFADDAIAEKPTPADVGGFVIYIPEFSMIVANASGHYVQYMTHGNQVYNPTGLLRVHLKGGHPQLGPSDGCIVKNGKEKTSLTLGPSWQETTGAWHSLAGMTSAVPAMTILQQRTSRTSFRVEFVIPQISTNSQPLRVAETIVLEPAGVTITDELTGKVEKVRISWPMLIFDGEEKTKVTIEGSTATLDLREHGVRFTILEPTGTPLQRSRKTLNHRNGQVEAAVAETSSHRVVYQLTPHISTRGNP